MVVSDGSSPDHNHAKIVIKNETILLFREKSFIMVGDFFLDAIGCYRQWL